MKSLLFISIFLYSCAGYRLQSKSNPFSRYSIRSISVPMFYNHTNLANISGVFTKEIFKTLTDFNDLEIVQNPSRGDAVLLGIVESNQKLRDTISTVHSKRVESTFGISTLGSEEEDFFVPSVNNIKLNLRIIVIKHPTPEEIKFLKTEMGVGALSSKIIFNERIPLSGNYSLKELRGEGIQVLGTQNKGLERKTINGLAKNAASSFKDMILYAF